MVNTISFGTDLELDGAGNLKLVNGLEGLRQKVIARLRFFQEEWFLDTTRGVPYLQQILKNNAEAGKVAGILDSEILREPEVTGLANVATSVNRAERTFTYSATVNSIHGTFEVAV